MCILININIITESRFLQIVHISIVIFTNTSISFRIELIASLTAKFMVGIAQYMIENWTGPF